ncbi:hypothetical protein FEM48_Zijuj09G0100900 [Ziziphus jujuba var. spinosa]|uniref:Protein CASPARIAN STRIP INTEGRITY FACTOR 1-like n=1 Tax=Ziziphus jujuba var. spinosa TaxID=714518 RepID=A0A978USD2_ZIZJJ|nr:hypothetical protein FEM48_Zijuj09G0100900 [Ziziphus jujuba var. spinosa]
MKGIMVLKQFSFVFLLISGSLLSSTSLAGRHFKSVNKCDKSVALDATDKVDILGSMDQKEADQDQIRSTIHERLLRVNTKDYGRYDPAPALVKPPFKLIPN